MTGGAPLASGNGENIDSGHLGQKKKKKAQENKCVFEKAFRVVKMVTLPLLLVAAGLALAVQGEEECGKETLVIAFYQFHCFLRHPLGLKRSVKFQVIKRLPLPQPLKDLN